MISLKLLNLLAVGGVAVFVCSLAPTANGLSGVATHQGANRLAAHQGISKRANKNKRSLTKRCKNRDNSTSSDVAASTTWSSSWVAPTSTDVVSSDWSSSDWSSSSDWTPTASDTPAWTPTSSSPPAASPTSGTSWGSKVGVAWTGSDTNELATVKTAQTNYLYNWSPWTPENAISLGYHYWPMLHDANQVSDFQSQVSTPAYSGQNILGFNEPEQSGQANIDAGTAASLWQQYIQPKADVGFGLISPAVTNDDQGIPWMQSFISSCNGCYFSAGCAVHVYTTSADDFKSYLNKYHDTLGSSCNAIHVTEFACQNFGGGDQPDTGAIWSFYSDVIQWMDSTDWIQSYFAFGILDNMDNVNQEDALISGGSPTSLGYTYINNSWQ
ncbi:glycosyl hydrolase catalytic core-domain-containing protein [Rhodofomes roseus]|uniref:Glycosyl hydrolase catalytic core-domain-containing protein n=1 Tax=Rhodofomes roseus TaxID=34475 RepID=A0A4Y9Z962_9APHY|nr:glycosyl hydrolase catalytic core-domain-containing protein [Rhodofomes roseus]KAH9844054.1 glycosyl hydrolase catalytic core-domain-containing protein [Rhodofomes roseus]TFY69929.1 hypothetical protein EVJ58_g156 [Rhodofomes roseus]